MPSHRMHRPLNADDHDTNLLPLTMWPTTVPIRNKRRIPLMLAKRYFTSSIAMPFAYQSLSWLARFFFASMSSVI